MKEIKGIYVFFICMVLIAVCLFAVYEPEEQKELTFEIVDDITIDSVSLSFIKNCDNITKESGIIINLKEELSPKEKKAFLYGILAFSTDFRDDLTEPLLTVLLECVNKTKSYYNYSDLPEGDDCIDENNCFIKWIDANVLLDETEESP